MSWQPVSKAQQKGKFEIGFLQIITLIIVTYQSNLDGNQILLKDAADSAVMRAKTTSFRSLKEKATLKSYRVKLKRRQTISIHLPELGILIMIQIYCAY